MRSNDKELTYSLTYKEVVDVLKLINESDTCKELQLELGDLKLTVVRDLKGSCSAAGATQTIPNNDGFEKIVLGEAVKAEPVTTESVSKRQSIEKQKLSNDNGEEQNKISSGVPVKAPMVGTFYRAPAPGEPPFVEVGSKVKEDDIIGIIDVMKLMNTIKAGQKGIVREICVENEQMVEYDQVLIIIDPVEF
ncbi:MAG: acetyl-CoA carboxylase biotin carboxyl carrier protein [Bacillota bacterium]